MAEIAVARNGSWAGWILSGIVALALFADGAVDLIAPGMVSAEMEMTGFPASQAPLLGIIILVCALLYVFPKTAVLGAILTTGFFGGAICTHFRLGEIASPPQLICVLLGAMTWGGLYLRDPRIRALLPFSA
jgi:hypothetical protein